MTSMDDIAKIFARTALDQYPGPVPFKEKKTLRSISRLMQSEEYITENQSKLFFSILAKNKKYFFSMLSDIDAVLQENRWQRPFKQLVKSKSLEIIEYTDAKKKCISMLIEFDKDLRNRAIDLLRNIDKRSRPFFDLRNAILFLLDEKSLMQATEFALENDFDISPEVMDLYNKLKSYGEESVKSRFDILNPDCKIRTQLTEEILSSNLLLEDRKIKYQYTNSGFENQDNLEHKLAARRGPKVHLTRSSTSLDEILDSLELLKRKRILFVFSEYDVKESLADLKTLAAAISPRSCKDHVGIYFRFDNKDHGLEFNKMISENGFNKRLDHTTEIVGISNTKLPKFLLSAGWYPDAVISLTNNFRLNRASVYCDAVDLIVYYTESPPVNGTVDEIL